MRRPLGAEPLVVIGLLGAFRLVDPRLLCGRGSARRPDGTATLPRRHGGSSPGSEQSFGNILRDYAGGVRLRSSVDRAPPS
jgi:hypothetical protein